MSLSVSLSPLRIGVVGAGNIGAPLARLWSQAGHAVKIANSRGPDSLTDVAQLTGATAATVAEAVKDANVVVVSIPQKNVAQLDKHTFSQLPADTIIIDTGTDDRHTQAYTTMTAAAAPVAAAPAVVAAAA